MKALELLPNDDGEIIRALSMFHSYYDIIRELVYNSIDAEAKCIEISINTDLRKVEVNDDG
jgi:DNA mismatch repair ATPase MutL